MMRPQYILSFLPSLFSLLPPFSPHKLGQIHRDVSYEGLTQADVSPTSKEERASEIPLRASEMSRHCSTGGFISFPAVLGEFRRGHLALLW